MPPRTKTTQALTADDARRIAVTAQGFALTPGRPKTVADVLRRTGAVQLDTISVLARSHELVAYARLGPVGRADVEDAYWSEPARAFEYYAHAACVLPLEVWPTFAFRRGQLGRGVWPLLTKTPILDEVRARLTEGPVTASDVGGARQSAGWWNWSAAKQALEVLYARGEAVCTMRRNWKRVYDLPERVVPPDLLKQEPSPEECYRDLVRTAGKALGVATRRDIAEYFYLLQLHLGRKLDRHRLLDDALASCGLTQLEVEGWDEPAYADPAALAAKPATAYRTTLLSPFDSLVWDRKRTQRVFGYALSLEAYKPKGDRIHGYFTMPLLTNGRIVGHVDPAREGRTLIARNAALHDPTAIEDMAAALREAASWVNCDTIRIDRANPAPSPPSSSAPSADDRARWKDKQSYTRGMALEFECIGIPFVDEATTLKRFQQLAALGDSHERSDGGRMILWLDDQSGAAMIFNTDAGGAIVCARPAFRTGTDFKGIATGFDTDPDGCRFCDPLLATQPTPNSDASPPFVFHLGNGGLTRELVTEGAPVDLIVTGFARSIRAWETEADYRMHPGNENSELHMMGFVYDPKKPTPEQYLITGQVLQAEKRLNSATNVEFWSMWLTTPFANHDSMCVVVRDEDLPWGVVEGSVVEANVWACAMLVS